MFLVVDEKTKMRDRMERLVLLPFSIGCVSESSVAIALPHPPRTPPNKNSHSSHHASPIRKREEDEESSSSTESMKNAFKFLPRPNISDRFHRLVRNIKTISQLFEYKDEMEEVEMEMEIGLPTDVKHVTHIGWDGTSNNNPIQGWDNLIPPELLSLHQPSPFMQFEISSVPSTSQNTPSSSNVALASTT